MCYALNNDKCGVIGADSQSVIPMEIPNTLIYNEPLNRGTEVILKKAGNKAILLIDY